MPAPKKVAFLSKEYPPYVYGGAGVHVEYLAAALAKTIDVEMRCFGDQSSQDGRLTVKGYPQWDETKRGTDPRFVGAPQRRDFPSPFVRFWMCVGVAVTICPLRRPDLILIAGGLFLLYKAVHEIHQRLEGEEILAEAWADILGWKP